MRLVVLKEVGAVLDGELSAREKKPVEGLGEEERPALTRCSFASQPPERASVRSWIRSGRIFLLSRCLFRW